MRQYNIIIIDKKSHELSCYNIYGYLIQINGHDCILHKSHIIGSEMWCVSHFFTGLQCAKAESIETLLRRCETNLTKNKKILIPSMFIESLYEKDIFLPLNKH